MIPGTNGTIKNIKVSNDAHLIAVKEVEKQLDDEFLLYKPSIAWILKVADLLKRYKLLSGKDYEIKTMEDSII